jgi:hypothetical protein
VNRQGIILPIGGKKGTKRSLAAGPHGLPIGIIAGGADRHDIKLLEGTLQSIITARPEGNNLCLPLSSGVRSFRFIQGLFPDKLLIFVFFATIFFATGFFAGIIFPLFLSLHVISFFTMVFCSCGEFGRGRLPSVHPCRGVGKQLKNRLFPALGKFGDSKKWQFWGSARSPW